MKNFKHRNISVHYALYGDSRNPPVVLLHGYLESLEIWKNFVPLLEDEFYLICPDLPGHGKSGVFSTTHTMEELADSVRDLILSLDIKKVHMAGHSMGGYVALAFADLYDEYLHSSVLFHSSCYPDTEEKRSSRNREIDLLRGGKKNVIVNTNIPMAFADDNLEEYHDELERVKEIASGSEEEGLIAVLNGMKLRPERCHVLNKDEVPWMLISGKKDNYIAFDVAQKIKDTTGIDELAILENSGHMGFIEERERSAEILKKFFKKHN